MIMAYDRFNLRISQNKKKYEEIKTVQSISYGKKWCENTNFCGEVMNSKRHKKEKIVTW